jgi:uncharacterized membrane protein YphA (DoxX/SURF4 family)
MRSTQAFWIYRIVRTILGIIFIWSGVSKLLSPDDFAAIISAYGLVSEKLVYPVAAGLPALEFAAGILLLFDIRLSLEAVTGMIILFIAVLWFGIVEDLDVDCGCFSPEEIGEQTSLRNAMYRDFLFLVMAVYMYIWRRVNRDVYTVSGPKYRMTASPNENCPVL